MTSMTVSRSNAIYLVYLVCMLRLAQKTQRRSPVLEGMEGFFWQMLTGEYAHLFLLGNAIGLSTTVAKYLKQPSATWTQAGLTSLHLAVVGLLVQAVRSNFTSAQHLQRAMIKYGLVSPPEARKKIGARSWTDWWVLWNPIPCSLSFPGTIQTVTYGWVGERHPHPLRMDIYRHEACGAMPPILLFIHGGGWILGSKTFIPSVFLHAMGKKGWLFCAMDYRKVPFVTFPDLLIDCKRALAYLRQAGNSRLQADTTKIVVCGESAGGHLASLVALTANDKSFQPGFEDVDCSVMACVDTYGYHDMTDRYGHFGRIDFQKKSQYYVEFVLKSRLFLDRPLFERASPLFWLLHDKATNVPPFLLIHGAYDSVIPMEDSREFYTALVAFRDRHNDRHDVPDVFVPLPDAEHAFNNIRSPRSLAYNDAVGVFLDAVLAASNATKSTESTQVAKL
ncbi:hypothetical protein AC1031_021564 [Aphanomyces cochlioides]|nr:hypothetical protein AC1031_021564 [Aphanomyces cochlioides]